MGFMDKIKKWSGADERDDNGYDDDGYYTDDILDTGYASDVEQQPMTGYQQPASTGYQQPASTSYQQPVAPAASSFSSGINIGGAALQMKVIRPDSFKNVPQIADHLLSQRTVVLNLEATDKETARRLIDFLSGVAYSIDGSIKRIANNAYIITPANVDVSGEQLRETRKPHAQPAPEEAEDETNYGY